MKLEVQVIDIEIDELGLLNVEWKLKIYFTVFFSPLVNIEIFIDKSTKVFVATDLSRKKPTSVIWKSNT